MRNTIANSAQIFSQAARLVMIRQPRFFLVVVVVLALGIGMSTALFSVMYGVLLKPLAIQGQDRLVVTWKGDPKDVAHVGELSLPEFRDWQRESEAFEQMAAMPTTVYGYGVTLTGFGQPVELERTPVTAVFFSLLGGVGGEWVWGRWSMINGNADVTHYIRQNPGRSDHGQGNN